QHRAWNGRALSNVPSRFVEIQNRDTPKGFAFESPGHEIDPEDFRYRHRSISGGYDKLGRIGSDPFRFWKRSGCRIYDWNAYHHFRTFAFLGVEQRRGNPRWSESGCRKSGARRKIRMDYLSL